MDWMKVEMALLGAAVGPSYGAILLRGASCGCLVNSRQICRLRRQDAEANIGAADGPKGEAREPREVFAPRVPAKNSPRKEILVGVAA